MGEARGEVVFARLAPAGGGVGGVGAGVIQVVEKLPIAVGGRTAGGEAGVVLGAGRAEVNAVEALADQAVAAPGVACAAGSPRRARLGLRRRLRGQAGERNERECEAPHDGASSGWKVRRWPGWEVDPGTALWGRVGKRAGLVDACARVVASRSGATPLFYPMILRTAAKLVERDAGVFLGGCSFAHAMQRPERRGTPRPVSAVCPTTRA